MEVLKEIVKNYHTPTAGTTYKIKLVKENNTKYIILKAEDKPYKITLSIEDAKKLTG